MTNDQSITYLIGYRRIIIEKVHIDQRILKCKPYFSSLTFQHTETTEALSTRIVKMSFIFFSLVVICI